MDAPCPECNGEGGYSMAWDDDLGIRHQDWVTCSCQVVDPVKE